MGDPAPFQGRIIFMSMFNETIWRTNDNEQECIANATLVSLFAKIFPAGRWSFLGPGSEKKWWYSTYNERRRGEWDRVAELMMIKFGESGHTVFRGTSPLSRGTIKSKGGRDTIETVFRTIFSGNQLSIYGAVSDLCEEYSACQTRTVRPVLARQSDPLSEPAKLFITTPAPSIEIPAQENLLLKYKERVERLSEQDRVIKICIDAGFLKNTWSRTVLRDKAHWRVLTIYGTKDMSWVHFATRWKINWPERLDSISEVTTSYLQCKHGVEIRIESVNKDNSHSWVRISHGLNTDLIDKGYDDNEQGTSQTKTEAFALKTDEFALASRSKAKAKPRRPTSVCSSTRNCTYSWKNMDCYWTRSSIQSSVPSGKKTEHSSSGWTIISRRRWAIEIWRLQDDLRNEFEHSQQWSDDMWKSKMTGGGGIKKRFQYCNDSSGQEILYIRALQGHSGRNPIDPTHQDDVLIPNNFFEYIYHIGCAINLQSITYSGLIPGGQNSSRERQTVFFTAVNPMNKDHKDPHELDLTKPPCIVQAEEVEKTPGYGILARYTAYSTKRIEVLSNKIERNHLFTIHSQLIVSRKLLWRKPYTRKYMGHLDHHRRFPSKIIGWKNGIQKSLEAAKHPTNPTKTKNPIIKNGETRGWIRVHQGRRGRYLVWSRGHQALNKNGETRGWIQIHPKLRVDAYKNWRRSNKNGKTRRWTRVHQGGGARHWLQSTRIVTCSCERSRTCPSSRACQKDRKPFSSRSISSRLAAE